MNGGPAVIDGFKLRLLQCISAADFGDISVLLNRLDAIQEQPQLIDPHLEELITPVVDGLLPNLLPVKCSKYLSDSYHLLYHYTKIRGAKVVVKFLPNDVHLLEPVISCLKAQPMDDTALWQARYILLLWLSLISMAPFNLRVFNQSTESDMGRIEIVERLVPLAESYLGSSGKEREAAGLLIARLLTRKDVNEMYIPGFFSRLMTTWNSPTCTINFRVGFLTCLCETFKIGNRDILLKHVELGLSTIRAMETAPELQSNTLLRKLRVKLAQRLALTLLRPARANWRYTNDPRSIDGSCSLSIQEEPSDPPEVVEEIIGILLESLRDKDTVVRYSSAKGIGRITSRLPKPFAEEIIAAIKGSLQSDTRIRSGSLMLSDSARDSTWHGSSLAIAELCRNGALTPTTLHELLPFVFLAIQFDIKKGSHSIGTSVRDAACYVMWSILRCYTTPVLMPFALQIASTLIVVAMFDREISVRRAASAAYQEGVGRHPEGVFPYGISVLSKADFFAVGQRRTSFLEVAPEVFQYKEYQGFILTYLLNTSCSHWDREIRELAGKCLGKLVESSEILPNSSSVQLFRSLLPDLIRNRDAIDVNSRHGAFYAMGEICHSLCKSVKENTSVEPVTDSCLRNIMTFGLAIPQYNFKGPQALLMYLGSCHYIARAFRLRLCQAALLACDGMPEKPQIDTFSNEPDLNEYVEIAIGAFSLADCQLRTCAADALASLFEDDEIHAFIAAMMRIGSLTSNLRTPSILKGWLTFFGLLNYAGRTPLFLCVLQIIYDATKIMGDKTRDDPETRKIAITSLGNLIPQIFFYLEALPNDVSQHANQVVDTLVIALSDYTVDSRGDVGSWVREAAVYSTCKLFENDRFWANTRNDNRALPLRLLESTISQCLGKIDNLRVASTRSLAKAFTFRFGSATSIDDVTYSLFENIIPLINAAAEALNNGDSSDSLFAHLTPLIAIEQIKQKVLAEYLISSSSGSQSTMSAASTALVSYLETRDTDFLDNLLSDMEILIRAHKEDDRVLIPVIHSIADLLDSQIFASTSYNFELLFNAIQDTTINTRTIPKIIASVRCYAALAGLEHQIKFKAWKKLSLSLGHRYPNIRVLSAELLYGILSNLDLEMTTDAEPIVQVLAESDWTLPPEKHKIDLVKDFTLP